MDDQDMWAKVPNPDMVPGLQRYYEDGIKPGHFLTALLSNDLAGAFAAADAQNIRHMFDWVTWIYNDFDRAAWGGVGIVHDWIAVGGKKGRDQ